MAYYPVDFNPRRKQLSYLRKMPDGSTRRVPIVVDVVTPPDQNVYPLHMDPVANPGDPVVIGVGNDQIELLLSGNPDSRGAGENQLNVLLNDRAIAADLVVSSFAGASGGQHFTIQGNFGPPPHAVTLASNLTTPGLKDLWMNGVTFDETPLVYNGPPLDSRDHPIPPNSTAVWDNDGVNVVFSDTHVIVPPPLPVPEETIITGAQIDGKATDPGTLAGLLERVQAGSTLLLPAGRFVGTSGMGAVKVKGAGRGQTILDATGLAVAFGKAVLVPEVSGAEIEDLSITGAAGPDNNAAGVRQQGAGIDFTLRRVEIYGCQDGVLTFAADVTIEDCDFHDNGAGDGLSHEIYLNGAPTSVATISGTTIRCGKGATHAVKSRAGRTTISGSSMTGSTDPTGAVGGSVVDIPDGGSLTVEESLIEMGQGAGQRELIGYAHESDKNGMGVVALGHTSVRITGEAGYIKAGRPGGTLELDNAVYLDGVAPTLQDWSEVDGEFTSA